MAVIRPEGAIVPVSVQIPVGIMRSAIQSNLRFRMKCDAGDTSWIGEGAILTFDPDTLYLVERWATSAEMSALDRPFFIAPKPADQAEADWMLLEFRERGHEYFYLNNTRNGVSYQGYVD